ncbi:hypothetical protein [Actinobaculum massiliense]|uniref:ATP-grasp domain-containing protein n=1 Tax=Actinobaculum massiliense ACS-171-V-Col2 TaxID=883066 RepID=K9EFS2_9ACTO|nr:hypothetical protein [Actinobaculum massiliense]EKU94731.1 hypothetical protein HMPREF9233_01678 [Actinobaculum massiliense ACS-171-V-Col2]MDK8319074.1 hypothetical protein [Actinobaculum massiliense]MDK8567206.1 hypothetical protein [Actinobaculum massiliense]
MSDINIQKRVALISDSSGERGLGSLTSALASRGVAGEPTAGEGLANFTAALPLGLQQNTITSEGFVSWLASAQEQTSILNHPHFLLWNRRSEYLDDLAAVGIDVFDETTESVSRTHSLVYFNGEYAYSLSEATPTLASAATPAPEVPLLNTGALVLRAIGLISRSSEWAATSGLPLYLRIDLAEVEGEARPRLIAVDGIAPGLGLATSPDHAQMFAQAIAERVEFL